VVRSVPPLEVGNFPQYLEGRKAEVPGTKTESEAKKIEGATGV
jgi:hypothetical protein